MKRLKSMGRSKSSSKAAAAEAAGISSQPPSANWPKMSPTPEHSVSQDSQQHNPPADTYINFSDDEIRAMEESALEYAIQQSQQTDRPAEGAQAQSGQQQEQPSHLPHQPPQQPHAGPHHSPSAMLAQPQQAYAAPPHSPSAVPAQPIMQSQSMEQPQWMQQNMQQGQSQTPFQANSQPLPEAKKKGNLMQRLGLKKQGSKSLATNPSANPSNPYPMAAGGHHPGRWGPQESSQNNPQPQQPNFGQQQGYSGSVNPRDDATAVAAAVAASELSAQESGRLSEQRSGQEQEEQAMVDLAIKESEVQAEYDNILREAKLLRLDLQHALTKCLEHRTNVQQEHSELSELMGDFDLDNAKGKGIAADHAIEQQFAQSEYNLKQANERVTAVNDAIHELQNLESFIRTTKPPADEAEMLTEEIIRQLLEKLNFLRLDFAPPKEKSVAPNYHSVNIVNRFREQQSSSAGPADPPRPPQTPAVPPFTPPVPPVQEEEPLPEVQPESSTAGTGRNPFEDEDAPGPSSSASSSLEPQQPDIQHTFAELTQKSPDFESPEADADKAKQGQEFEQSHVPEETVTPMTTPRPEPQITTPAAVPPAIPPRSPSVNSIPSPRVLNTTDSRSSNESGGGNNRRALNRFDSRSSNESGGGNNVAMSQSKEQSRQLLEKASQKLASLLVNANDKNFDATRKPGDPAVRRAPQVVHLYQELRKVMGDDFMVQDLNTQDVKASLLAKMQVYQALSPADEQARQRALAQSPSAVQAAKTEADKHSRMLTKLGAQISTTRLRSMEDVLPLVQEAEQQLSVLRADEGLTVSQFEAWPKQRLDVLREAAGQFRELNYLQVKYQKWMLQQGTCLEEAARIEEFFDTARARVEWLTNRQDLVERRFANHGVPWDRAVFKATRHASLHLAVIYMSRILFEVANLERSTALKNEQCLLHLSDAVRIGYKAHQFAGGFNVDSAELFGKVKRLTQYYMRSMDPTWLKDTTKFVNSNGQRFDHVQRR